MDSDCNPVRGILQPRYGISAELIFPEMPRKPPPPDYVRALRLTLARNLRANMNALYRHIASETNRAIALKKDSGVSKNTILRMLDDEEDSIPGVDKIAMLANALNLSVPDLLDDHTRKKKNTRREASVKVATEPLKGALQRLSSR